MGMRATPRNGAYNGTICSWLARKPAGGSGPESGLYVAVSADDPGGEKPWGDEAGSASDVFFRHAIGLS